MRKNFRISLFLITGVVSMKHMPLRVSHALFVCSLIALAHVSRSDATSSFFGMRTQRFSLPYSAGMVRHYNQPESQDTYGTLNLTTGYTRTFRSDRIADCLFGNIINDDCLTPTIKVTGSRVLNRNSNDVLADYFGLPTDYQSSLLLQPRISNFITGLYGYFGLEEIAHGLFCTVYAPLTHTRWGLHIREETIQPGILGYDAGYFGPAAVTQADLVQNALDFLSHKATPNLNDNTLSPAIPVLFEPLCSSRLSTRVLKQTRFAEITFELGFKAIEKEDFLFALSGFFAAPTGGRPKGKYIFEPLVGNGHHPELGAGITIYSELWHSRSRDMQIGFWIDAHVSHLFPTHQHRVFDLIGKENSRYMLAENLTSSSVNLFANPNPGNQNGSTAPSAQFNNHFAPVANLTRTPVTVKSQVQVDVSAFLNFQHRNCELDFGYRFWRKSCEDISTQTNCSSRLAQETGWALKGDAAVYGFSLGPTPIATDTPIALSATESLATINSGTNNFIDPTGNLGGVTVGGTLIRPTANPGVDNAQFARTSADAVGIGANIDDRTSTFNPQQQTLTSNNPVFLSAADIDICSAKTGGMSHSFFMNLNYTWFDNDAWLPFVGFGGKAEFGKNSCDELCNFCSPSEWGVWFTIGASFQ